MSVLPVQLTPEESEPSPPLPWDPGSTSNTFEKKPEHLSFDPGGACGATFLFTVYIFAFDLQQVLWHSPNKEEE